MKTRDAMVRAIGKELRLRREYAGGEKIETIYFGGGTPSLLDAAELSFLLDAIAEHYDLTSLAEVTLEANPDDLSERKLQELKALGVNRLSIGVQTFNDSHLAQMNRTHTSVQALKSVSLAQQQGLTNLSIDLIYAIPHCDHSVWTNDLRIASDLGVPHISAYSLTIEEKTAFGRWLQSGKLTPASEQFAAEQFEILTENLTARGYEQYEISNFARDGAYSIHNSGYWQQKKYMGVGPGAHSFDGHSRQYNVSNNTLYISSLNKGKIPCTVDAPEGYSMFNDFLLTSLRTKWGTDLDTAYRRWNVDLLKEKASELALLQREQLLLVSDRKLSLTQKGKLLADEIVSRLMM